MRAKTPLKNLLFVLLIFFTCKADNLNFLTLLSPKTQPLKDINLTLRVKDKNNQFITNNIIWIVKPKDSIKQNGTNIITPLQDTDITLQVQYNDTLSNKITLHVKWIVNNHELPPKPDPKINNSTLLGIDVNNNDVRDDVERWIYETYKDKHPICIDILMQAGRDYKKVLEMPERALEITEKVSSSMYCEWYYAKGAEYFGEKTLIDEDEINREYFRKKIYFNTKERYRVYDEEYDRRLSGHVFSSPKRKDEKSYCDFNTSKYDKK